MKQIRERVLLGRTMRFFVAMQLLKLTQGELMGRAMRFFGLAQKVTMDEFLSKAMRCFVATQPVMLNTKGNTKGKEITQNIMNMNHAHERGERVHDILNERSELNMFNQKKWFEQ